jgi:NADH dehydrogenase FAD-containing subunit
VTPKHLILAGAGHAHLDLLGALAREVPAGWAVTVVTPQPDFHYSGMLPAILGGVVAPAAADIPVAAIARAAGLDVRIASVAALDTVARFVTLDDGSVLPYDLLSLDVGSRPAHTDTPGAATETCAVRPFSAALTLMSHVDRAVSDTARSHDASVTVVGGGAAGVEVAFALRARIARAGRVPRVTIVDAATDDVLLPLTGFPHRARKLAARALARRQIAFIAGQVTAVTAAAAEIAARDGSHRRLPASVTAWVTGAAAHPWLAGSGLACDVRGFPFAGATLALDTGATVFGGGDCVTLRDARGTAKAGVYAVRMAPVLAQNVLARMRGQSALVEYSPQRNFLALLSTSDGEALLHWKGVAVEARWAQRLKSWIDGRYLSRYRALASTTPRAGRQSAAVPSIPSHP